MGKDWNDLAHARMLIIAPLDFQTFSRLLLRIILFRAGKRGAAKQPSGRKYQISYRYLIYNGLCSIVG